MNHQEAKILIDDYIDDKLQPETALELEQHINDCNLCSDTVFSLRKLKEDVENLSSKISPGKDLWKDISAIIHDKKIKTIEEDTSKTKIRNIGESKKARNDKKKKKTKEIKRKSKKETSFKNIFDSRILKISSVIILGIALILLVYLFFFSGPEWMLIKQAGNVKVNGELLTGEKSVGSGDIILTDIDSRAFITLPEIGRVVIDEDTKVEKLPDENKLKVFYGSIRIEKNNSKENLLVSAGNKSITGTNLNAEYNLKVSRDGTGLIAVTTSRVKITDNDVVVIPVDFRCSFYPEEIGLPYHNNSSIEFVAAIDELISDKNVNQAIDIILSSAGLADAITIFYMLEHTPLQERVRVFNTLYNLVPPPSGVKKGGVLNLDKNMLDRWFDKIMSNY